MRPPATFCGRAPLKQVSKQFLLELFIMRHPAPPHVWLARSAFASVPLLAIALLSVSFAEPPEPPPGPSAGPPRVEPDGPPPPRPGRGEFRGGQQPRGDRPPFERGQFRPEAGGQRPRPTPERFVERAMRYDDDKDGKLDRDELTTFAEDLMERFGPGRDEPPPPPREKFDRGEFPEGGKRPDRPFDGERPERPRRPDGEDFPERQRPRRPLEDQPPPPPAAPEVE